MNDNNLTDPIYEAELHIPVEQYGFIAVKVKDTATGLLEAYKAISRANSATPNELPAKEFNAALDEFLLTSNLRNGVEIYGKMSPAQQACFQEIKKSFKRMKARQDTDMPKALQVVNND